MANLWDHVEDQAAKRRIPRMTLWRQTLRAVAVGDLRVRYPEPITGGPDWGNWMAGMAAAAIRDNDPLVGARYLRLITVNPRAFDAWAQRGFAARRGPAPGAASYAASDLMLCKEIEERIRSGAAKSVRDALLAIVRAKGERAIAGSGTFESRYKRVVARYQSIYR